MLLWREASSKWDNDAQATTHACGPRRESMKRLLLALLLVASLMPASFAADTKPDETPAPKIKVGDVAPDFTLTDQNGNKVSLHDFKGKKNVALAFYIFAFTGG
jgi:cytochrome oxidase Cu insertion factor (SCO1/SenC/PrrC family)